VTAIDDGLGGSLVWLTDADVNLWVCSADAAGKIYAYVMMTSDLLKGAGAWLVPDESFSDDEFGVARPDPNPLDIAELACKAFFRNGNPGKVIGGGQDGLFHILPESGAYLSLRCDRRCPGLGICRDRRSAHLRQSKWADGLMSQARGKASSP
jgi:hypothetical protein